MPVGELSPSDIAQLLAQHAPLLFLHHRDKHLPSSVEHFLASSALVYFNEGVTGVHSVGKAWCPHKGKPRARNGMRVSSAQAELSCTSCLQCPAESERSYPRDRSATRCWAESYEAAAACQHEQGFAQQSLSMHALCGQVTQARLLEVQGLVPDPTRLSLVVPPDVLHGSPPDQLSDVPLYAHIKVSSAVCAARRRRYQAQTWKLGLYVSTAWRRRPRARARPARSWLRMRTGRRRATSSTTSPSTRTTASTGGLTGLRT